MVFRGVAASSRRNCSTPSTDCLGETAAAQPVRRRLGCGRLTGRTVRGGADAIRLAQRDFPAARTHEALTVRTCRTFRDAVARQGMPAIAPWNLLATECVRGASSVDRHRSTKPSVSNTYKPGRSCDLSRASSDRPAGLSSGRHLLRDCCLATCAFPSSRRRSGSGCQSDRQLGGDEIKTSDVAAGSRARVRLGRERSLANLGSGRQLRSG